MERSPEHVRELEIAPPQPAREENTAANDLGMSRKYIAALAVAAALVLIAGSAVRPRQAPAPQPQAAQQPQPPPSRRGQMRQISEFLAERATESAQHVVYVPGTRASGVVLTSGAVVSSSTGTSPLIVALERPPDTAVPVRLAPEGQFSQGGAWIVIVGRNSDGETISASGILGGTADATCSGARIRKLLLNVPLDSSYAGAGVFDITGDLLGVVGQCDGSWVGIAHPSVMRLLDEQSGTEAIAWRDFGVHIAEPGPAAVEQLKLRDKGLFVTEVRRNSKAAAIGIRPGDQVLSSGEFPMEKPEDLFSLGDSITLLRGGRIISLPSEPVFSFDDGPTGPVLTTVKPGSRLYEAGLREGDRLIRAATRENPSPAYIATILARPQPVYVIYERDDRRIGVLVR